MSGPTTPSRGVEATPQLPDEGSRPYQAALTYFELGPRDRSIDAVARLLNKSRTIIGRYSGKYRWVERARIYDSRLEEARQAGRESVAARAAARHEIRKLDMLESIYQDSIKLRARGRLILDWPLVIRESEDRKTIIKPARFSISTAAALLRVAAELGVASLDASDVDVESMGDDELKAIVAARADFFANRLPGPGDDPSVDADGGRKSP